jgi:hypothetical protein
VSFERSDSHHCDEEQEQDPDPHESEKLDPDPHFKVMQNPWKNHTRHIRKIPARIYF